MKDIYKKGYKKLIISETGTSSWHYHLREIGKEGVKLSGGMDLYALCGKELGWDTEMPLSCYGESGHHVPENWCKECAKIAGIKTEEPKKEKL